MTRRKPELDMTERVYTFIKDWVKEHTYPPTLTEISEGVYMSRSGIYRHLGKLEGQGKIWRDEKRARGIRLLEEEHDR